MLTDEQKELIHELTKSLDKEGLKQMRMIIHRETRKRKGKFVGAYIHGEFIPYLDIVKDYLYENGYIKHKSNHALTSFATETLIKNVIMSIKKSQETPENTTTH